MNKIKLPPAKGIIVLKLLLPTFGGRLVATLLSVIFLVAFCLTELLGRDWIGIFAALAAIPLTLICGMLMPLQMVALASSKTASYLHSPRPFLLAIYSVFGVLLSAIICWFWNLSQLNHFSPQMFFVVWLVVSLVLQLNVCICSRWPHGGFFLLLVFAFLDEIMKALAPFHVSYIALSALFSWLAFANWWINWKPAKYKVNPMFVDALAREQMVWGHGDSAWFAKASAQSWIGSRLTGVPDGLLARAQHVLPKFFLGALGFLPGYFLMGGEWLRSFGFLFLMVSGGFVAQIMLLGHGLNLRRIWLYSSGSRKGLFALLYCRFWSDVLPLTLLLIALAVVLGSSWNSLTDWLYFLLSLFLLQALAFHVYWWAYQRSLTNPLLPTLVGMALVCWWFLMSFATGFLIQGREGWPSISPLWIVIPELVLLLLLYRPVRTGFAKVDFARLGK